MKMPPAGQYAATNTFVSNGVEVREAEEEIDAGLIANHAGRSLSQR